MPNSPYSYGLTPQTFERSQRSLGYDLYREMAQARAAAQASVAFQVLQTGLLHQMSGSLYSIHAEMMEVRQLYEEAVAIQQELLSRDQMQAYLEEFIYQAEKLIKECLQKTDIPLSARYFVLVGVLDRVEDEGLGTAIIRGRDNKAAFEQALFQAKRLSDKLAEHQEVKAAIAWGREEARRIRERQQQEMIAIQTQVQTLEQRLGVLASSKRRFTIQDIAAEQWGRLASISDPTQQTILILATLCLLPVLLFPLLFALPFIILGGFIMAKQKTAEYNRSIEEEMAAVCEQLSAMEDV